MICKMGFAVLASVDLITIKIRVVRKTHFVPRCPSGSDVLLID